MGAKRTQLLFYDDRSFEFIRRPIENECVVQKDGPKLERGWVDVFAVLKAFGGFKKIPSNMLLLSYERDILLDFFNQMPKGTGPNAKPDLKLTDSLQKWIARVAENQRGIYANKFKKKGFTDWIQWTGIGVVTMESLLVLIRFAIKAVSHG